MQNVGDVYAIRSSKVPCIQCGEWSQDKLVYDLAGIVNDVSDEQRDIIVCNAGWDNEYTANNDRIRRELPEWELTDMRTAVAKLYGWYKEHIDSIDVYSLIYG